MFNERKIGNLGKLDIGDRSETVKNKKTGKEIELCPEAMAVYSLIKHSEILSDYIKLEKALVYFSKHWPEAYSVLVD